MPAPSAGAAPAAPSGSAQSLYFSAPHAPAAAPSPPPAAAAGDSGEFALELDAFDAGLAELDRQRAAVVRRSLRAALALADLPTNCLAAVRQFAGGAPPPQAVVGSGGARAGYAPVGPNLGAYAQAVLAAEWADVGLPRAPGGGSLEVLGRALPLPPGHCAGAPDGEEETLEEDAGEEGCAGCGAAAEGGEGEGEGEGEEGEGDQWDTAAAAAAAALYAAHGGCGGGGGGGGCGGGGGAVKRSLWSWDRASSSSGTQSPSGSATLPPGASGRSSRRNSGLALFPPPFPSASGRSSRRNSGLALLIPPPSFLPPCAAAAAAALARRGHYPRSAPLSPGGSSGGGGGGGFGGGGGGGGGGGSGGGGGKVTFASASASPSSARSTARPLSPGQLQVIGTRLWVGGAGPPTREDFATAQKGTYLSLSKL